MNRAINTATKSLALTSLVLVGGSFALGGVRFGLGALIGTFLIGASWALTVYACRRVLDTDARTAESGNSQAAPTSASAGGLLVAGVVLAKIALIAGVVHASIRFLQLEPMSLAVGVVALVVSLVIVSRRLADLADVDDASNGSREAVNAAR